MTMPGRPTSPPPDPKRSTIAQAIADHPNPWPQMVIGTLFILASAALVYRAFPVALADKIFDGIPFIIGVCVLPTMPSWIAAGAKKIGPAITQLNLLAKKDAAVPPADGGAT